MDMIRQILLRLSDFSSSLLHGVKEKCQIMQKTCGNQFNRMHQVCLLCITLYVRLETLPMTNSAKQEQIGTTNYRV